LASELGFRLPRDHRRYVRDQERGTHQKLHVGVGVLDSAVLPAVDSPEPGGLTDDQLSRLARTAPTATRVVGLELTIYDPVLDPHADGPRLLTRLLVESLSAR
jgi:arginase